jgi:hypothetical protein
MADYQVPVRTTEAQGIFQSDIIIRSALEEGIADLRRNPWLLDYVFASEAQDDLTRAKYGERDIAQARKWFQNNQISVRMVPVSNEPKPFTISIKLVSSSETEVTTGDTHYIPQEENDLTWPNLLGPVDPIGYDPATGIITWPQGTIGSFIIVSDMLVLLRDGTRIPVVGTAGADTIQIRPGAVGNLQGMVVRGVPPTGINFLESVLYNEVYQIGVHCAAEPTYLTWLHSIVCFILLRYKQDLLEHRGFEQSVFSSSDFSRNPIVDTESFFSRYITITGKVRQYWPKAFTQKILVVEPDVKVISNLTDLEFDQNWGTVQSPSAAAGAAASARRPTMFPSGSSLSFSAIEGGSDPALQTLAVFNSGGGSLASPFVLVTYGTGATGWLDATIVGGGDAFSLQVAPSTGSLAAGSYSAQVSINSPGASNTPQVVDVGFTVSVAPVLALSPGDLSFTATAGGANPASQDETVSNTGGGILPTVTTSINYLQGSGWLGLTQSGSGNSQLITAQPVTGSLTVATYNAVVSVFASGVTNSPQTFNVSFDVTSGHFNPPAGGVDFTGWLNLGVFPAQDQQDQDGNANAAWSLQLQPSNSGHRTWSNGQLPLGTTKVGGFFKQGPGVRYVTLYNNTVLADYSVLDLQTGINTNFGAATSTVNTAGNGFYFFEMTVPTALHFGSNWAIQGADILGHTPPESSWLGAGLTNYLISYYVEARGNPIPTNVFLNSGDAALFTHWSVFQNLSAAQDVSSWTGQFFAACTVTLAAVTDVHSAYSNTLLGTGSQGSGAYKAGTVNFITIWDQSNDGAYAIFDLSLGTVAATAGGAVGAITSLGSGWYLCQCTTPFTTSFRFTMADTALNAIPQTVWTSAGTETVFVGPFALT